jgi:hypothetical protein
MKIFDEKRKENPKEDRASSLLMWGHNTIC